MAVKLTDCLTHVLCWLKIHWKPVKMEYVSLTENKSNSFNIPIHFRVLNVLLFLRHSINSSNFLVPQVQIQNSVLHVTFQIIQWHWIDSSLSVFCFPLPIIILPILLRTTNKMQRYTIFFITVNAVHVSGGFSAHHQELKTVHTQYFVYVELACCYR